MSYQGQILLDAGTNELEIVEFQIRTPGNEAGCYGINVAKVKEIVTVPEILAFPNSHPAVAGAINLRGKIIGLVDLGVWLGYPSTTSKKSRVIVTEFNNVVTGFIVDAASRIHRITWEQVDSPPADISVGTGGCLTSVVRMDDRMILMLDFEAIIADINPNTSLSANAIEAPAGLAREDKLILVAEDSGSIRKIIVNTLQQAGYRVSPHEDGESAWNYLDEHRKTGADMPDMVISDIEMPKVDGMHLLSRIKAENDLMKTPVVLFSSLGSDSNRDKALKLGAQDLIGKPDLPRLIELVDTLLH